MARTKKTPRRGGDRESRGRSESPPRRTVTKKRKTLASPPPSPARQSGAAAAAGGGRQANTGRRPPYRHRPGTKALQEIRRFQKTTDLLIPKLPFSRLVKEIQNENAPESYRWTAEALLCLQTAAETYLTELMSDAQLCSFHAKRVTLMIQDIRLARRLRGMTMEAR
eukprot:GDKI01028278.1.p1 GENE.GDKI01028278.1~~GDKI01028278.1.p1  ORF type:complete len:167 (-),score=26.10 GDKI01028278.1:30-530(-)